MAEVLVAVQADGADAVELDELARVLRGQLLELDVDDVTRAPGGAPPPPGTRVVDVAAVGALIVTLQPSLELAGMLVSAVRAWLRRGPASRAVELTIGDSTLKLTAASQQEQDRLVEEFVRAASRG